MRHSGGLRQRTPPHHPYVPWIKHFPAFKPLHDDPRFGDLLRRLKFPE